MIHTLTQSPPRTQQAALEHVFLPNASFTHPFVRTGAWDVGNGLNSRAVITAIYRWYRVLSPRIALSVSSVAFDAASGTAYATVRQRFAVWFVPLYAADVELVVRLRLVRDRHWGRWYVAAQDDCYPVVEASKFVWLGIWRVVWLLQVVGALLCVLGAWVGSPVTMLQERWHGGEQSIREAASELWDRQTDQSKEHLKASHNGEEPVLKILEG